MGKSSFTGIKDMCFLTYKLVNFFTNNKQDFNSKWRQVESLQLSPDWTWIKYKIVSYGPERVENTKRQTNLLTRFQLAQLINLKSTKVETMPNVQTSETKGPKS